ncbi:MAG TPA: hypothetical protein VGC86_13535 [Afipia sp.]
MTPAFILSDLIRPESRPFLRRYANVHRAGAHSGGIRPAGSQKKLVTARFLDFSGLFAAHWRKIPPIFVVEMPHCGKTAFRTLKTPKKAAFARVFRFSFR